MALNEVRRLLREVEGEMATVEVRERLALATSTPLDRAVAKLARALKALTDEVERLGQHAEVPPTTGAEGAGPDKPA